MDPVDRLVACEDIRQLLSRRTRLIDGKHWEELIQVYADDVPAHHLGVKGNRLMVEEVARRLEGVRSIHQLHLPEIEVTSPTTAKAITPMEDLLMWEDDDGQPCWAHGYGHYHQSFVKVTRGWVISDHKLTRQYIQQGKGEFDLSAGDPHTDARFTMPLTPLPAEF